MAWIAIATVILAIFGFEGAVAQECTGDSIEGFECSVGFSSGPVFTPSTTITPSPLARGVVEEFFEEREEEAAGGGASADEAGLGVVLNGLAAFKDVDEGRTLGYDSSTFGVSVGTDYTRERFVIGASLDYLREDTDFDNDTGETDTDEIGLQLIGIGYPVGDLYVIGSTRFAYDMYDTERANGAEGDPDGHKVTVIGGTGYDLGLGSGIVVGLSGLLRWEWARVDSYSETGGDPIATDVGLVAPNLEYDDDDAYTLTSILEVNAQRNFSVPWGVLIPEVVFRYLHEFESDARTINAEVIDPAVAPTRFISFRTRAPDRDYFNLGAALTTVLPNGLALFANYHAELGHSWREEHVINFGVRTSLDSLFGPSDAGT